MVQLIVLYPQPADAKQFESDYVEHLELLHVKANIPTDVKPYTVTNFLPANDMTPPFYKMFTMPFESPEALDATMASLGMQEVAAHASRISTGGPITILVGSQA
jgi:uncharacterized protein (TIGR02118 family)